VIDAIMLLQDKIQGQPQKLRGWQGEPELGAGQDR
jgi:hypothetical protein